MVVTICTHGLMSLITTAQRRTATSENPSCLENLHFADIPDKHFFSYAKHFLKITIDYMK
jgi:hypothetical protein